MSLSSEFSRFLLDGSNGAGLSRSLGDRLGKLQQAAGSATSDESRATFESAAHTLGSLNDTLTLGKRAVATPGEIRAAARLGDVVAGKGAPIKPGEADAAVKRLQNAANVIGGKGWNLSTVHGEAFGTVGRDLLNLADLMRGLADDVSSGKLGARIASYWPSMWMDERFGESTARANAYLAGGKPAYDEMVAKHAALGRKFIF